MSIREKNGKWEYRFRLNGVRVTCVTDLEATEQNRPRAERLESKRRDAILKGESPVRRQAPRGFLSASVEFVESLKTRQKEKASTVKRVETSMASLREWFEHKNLGAIRPADVERFSNWRLATHQVKPVTLRHDLDNLSKFFEWCIRLDICMENPVKEVEKPSTEDAVRMHVLTPSEEFEYFERIEEDGEPDLADMARLMLDQGMRPEEVLSLERRGVDLKAGRIQIFQGKTKAAKRLLRLTPASLMIIERRMTAYNGSWLFPSPRVVGGHLIKLNANHNAVCAARKDDPGGLPDRSELFFVPYDLRHSFATRAAQSGMDVVTLAAILGHSSLRMVIKYVHPQQDHMDSEMDKLSQAQFRPRPGREQAQYTPMDAIQNEATKKPVSSWKN